jgi:hypothetical protein
MMLEDHETLTFEAQRTFNLLGKRRFVIGGEYDVQDQVEAALETGGVVFQREKILDRKNRIDFLCAHGTGIEIKIKGGKREIFRQLQRYAEFDSISALILVSSVALGLPPRINDKPVLLLSIGAAWL